MSSVTDTAPAKICCKNCGAEFLPDEHRCPACGRAVSTGSSRIVLAVTLILIFAGFGLTQYLVKLHRNTESALAVRWFTRGEQAMHANLPSLAADDYRTALSYDPENRQYRLRLAQALLAANRLNEARAHLASLWELEPADGEVNITLARLYVRRDDYSNAVRYYGNAINGVWPQEPRAHRIATRFELADFLLQQHNTAQAQAELVAIQADGPSDPADQLLLGNLLLQVNEPRRAAEAFDALLQLDPNSAQAWLGKAQASLALADYKEAERGLANAVERDPALEDARRQLTVVREVLSLDPAARELSVAERSRRAARAFQAAMQRVNGCATQLGVTLVAGPSAQSATAAPAEPAAANSSPADQLQQLYNTGVQKQPAATEPALRKNPDAIEPAMQYVFDVERATAPLCSQMDVSDRALLILAQHEREAVR